MKYLIQKVYSFVNADGERENISKKDIKIIVNDNETKAHLEDIFKGNISREENKVVGWSILQYFNIKEGFVENEKVKISFVDEEGHIYQLVSVKNPLIQLNDKKLDDEYFNNVQEILNSVEDYEEKIGEELEEKEETVIENTSKEDLEDLEEDVDKIIEEKEHTKFERDSKKLVDRGYKIENIEDYRLLKKEGAIPILIKEVSPEHYEEYEFVDKEENGNLVFKDFENKRITIVSD